jgi:hypothetical protein
LSFISSRAGVAAAFIAAFILGTADAATIPVLGTAGNYAVLGLANTSIVNSLVTINGNEGVSQGGQLSNNAPSVINGNVYEAASGQYSGPGHLNGSLNINAALLAQNDADAINAFSQATGLTATQTFGAISSATTITGNGGLNVIHINGDISLNNASLTLTGSSTDVFVLDVTGNINLVGNGGLTVAGSLNSADVLYALTGNSGSVNTHVGNSIYGTVIAPAYNFNLDGTFNGELIGGGGNITLKSGATVNAQPFVPGVPEPSTVTLIGSGLLALTARFRKYRRNSSSL